MKRIISISIMIINLGLAVMAQTGGDNTYEFLNLSSNSLVSSLGGMNVSISSNDPSLALYNPANLSNESSGSLSLNYVNYLAGINYGYAAYSLSYEKYGSFSAGINYFNYGKFDLSDPSGNINGTFRASEYALNLIWAYQIDSLFRLGVNIKPIISHLESYNSLGLAIDLGGHYTSRNRRYTAGLTIRNIGTQLTSYTGYYENLPFEIIAGGTARLAHAPFRFSLTARHIEKYDLIHNYKEADEYNPQDYEGAALIAENVMRHLLLSLEFIPSENFFLSAGFNYQRRKELVLETRGSTVGFSMGAGIKLSGFDLCFSRSRYHLAGSLTNISILLKPALLRRRN